MSSPGRRRRVTIVNDSEEFLQLAELLLDGIPLALTTPGGRLADRPFKTRAVTSITSRSRSPPRRSRVWSAACWREPADGPPASQREEDGA